MCCLHRLFLMLLVDCCLGSTLHRLDSLPRTETASLLVCVDDHIRLVLGRLVLPVVVGFLTRSTVFRSFPRVSFPRVALQKLRLLLALLFFVYGFWGPGPWLFCFTGSRVPSLAVSFFFTAIWHVFQPTYNSPPWSESKRCPRSLQTALLSTSHK